MRGASSWRLPTRAEARPGVASLRWRGCDSVSYHRRVHQVLFTAQGQQAQGQQAQGQQAQAAAGGRKRGRDNDGGDDGGDDGEERGENAAIAGSGEAGDDGDDGGEVGSGLRAAKKTRRGARKKNTSNQRAAAARAGD